MTGTDANGGMIDVSSNTLPVLDSNTQRPPGTCAQDAAALCAQGGRFRLSVDWNDFEGNTGQGLVTDGQRFDNGAWFEMNGALGGTRNPDGFDVFAQLANNCEFDNHFWVLAEAATNVEYTLTVTDTQTHQTKTYSNPLGNFAPAITETEAFATCP
ncbi:MAG: hypothetical protein OSB03_07435 [Vicinamibacterales bacterium]|nr:hypothetical protein [Vicinamibacterales bacterium]